MRNGAFTCNFDQIRNQMIRICLQSSMLCLLFGCVSNKEGSHSVNQDALLILAIDNHYQKIFENNYIFMKFFHIEGDLNSVICSDNIHVDGVYGNRYSERLVEVFGRDVIDENITRSDKNWVCNVGEIGKIGVSSFSMPFIYSDVTFADKFLSQYNAEYFVQFARPFVIDDTAVVLSKVYLPPYHLEEAVFTLKKQTAGSTPVWNIVDYFIISQETTMPMRILKSKSDKVVRDDPNIQGDIHGLW